MLHPSEDHTDRTMQIKIGLTFMIPQERGLSSAVLKGFDMAAGKFVICMDGDLQHPPEKVPEFLQVRAMYACNQIKDKCSHIVQYRSTFFT